MLFMNEWDIATAAQRYADHPVLGRATRFLDAHKDQVNAHSDGWPYWSAAVRPCAKLMTLVQQADTDKRAGLPLRATEADLKAAIAPIRAFYTRRGNAAGTTFPSAALE